MFLNKNYVKTYNEKNINNFNEDRVSLFFFFNFLFFFSLPSCNHYSIVHEPERVSVTDFFYASGSSMTQQGAASQPTDRS